MKIITQRLKVAKVNKCMQLIACNCTYLELSFTLNNKINYYNNNYLDYSIIKPDNNDKEVNQRVLFDSMIQMNKNY